MSTAEKDALGGALMAPLLDHLSDGIFVVGPDRRISLFNQAAERITGVPADEAVGETCHRIFTGADSGVRCAISQRRPCTVRTVFRTGRPSRPGDATVQFPSGRRKTLNLRAVPLFDSAGEVARVAVMLHDISELHELRQELEERYEFHNIIGKNHQMREIFGLIDQIADTDATVTIQGESGTGKELVARAIHFHSGRARNPFVQVNCSALVETLLESELFGHAKGAFTGAVRDKIGRFEAADGGTIFLDEIGDISPAVQVKLLRVIQERTFERVGENRQRTCDVRIIAATNRNLKQLMKQGGFREDLYYRLRVVPVHLPPLRERRDDIPLLVDAFVERFREKMDKPIRSVSSAALARMMDYDWPGNVRELENAIEHALVRSTGPELRLADLPVELRTHTADEPPPESTGRQPDAPSRETLRPDDRDEREIILSALAATDGNKTAAARRLGIGRTTLWRRMKELDITWPKYRTP
ncbi:MAG: sigma 54-interacting transcriptional regulator [Planctomycetota bacterium]